MLTGVADLASQRGWMDFNVQNVSEKLIQQLWPKVSFKVGLLAATANTNGTIRISHGDLAEVNATVRMLGVRLADSDGLQPMASSKWIGRFDGAIQGFGGCPMAKDDLTGNMPTEKMLSYFTQQKAHDLNAMSFESAYNEATKIFSKYH